MLCKLLANAARAIHVTTAITIKPFGTGRLHTRAINPFGFMTSAFHRIHKALGPGLLESNYELAMAVELGHLGIPFVRQQQYPVYYRNQLIGYYTADMVVDGKIILELKSVSQLTKNHEAQLLNYLGLSGVTVGLVTNLRFVARPCIPVTWSTSEINFWKGSGWLSRNG